jgi:hypothetical protein
MFGSPINRFLRDRDEMDCTQIAIIKRGHGDSFFEGDGVAPYFQNDFYGKPFIVSILDVDIPRDIHEVLDAFNSRLRLRAPFIQC